MKILVIFTGGTIGSITNNGIISIDSGTQYMLIDEYKKNYSTDVIFETLSPYNELSENNTGLTISMLVSELKSVLAKGYDGIIITHGTDTLQYSASALWYLVTPQIPVLLVSSNYVLTDSRANGHANFKAAVDYIINHGKCGIYISYRNSDNITRIYEGISTLNHLPYSDDLYALCDIKDKPLSDLNPPKKWNSDVMRIFPYVGMKYPLPEEHTKAVLLDTYHSGTICTASPDSKKFFDELFARKIPVFLIGMPEGDSYESTKAYEDRHIIVLRKASPISMYMKLFIVTENYSDYDTIVKYMTDV